MPTITSEIIIAYSQCPRKAYLLLFKKEQGIAVEYIELLEKREKQHREACLNSIATIPSEITLSQRPELKYLGKYLSKVTLTFKEFQAKCDLLEKDQVKWHNNTAENAIRHLAKQRGISISFSESVTPSYLRLLGIKQTCRFQSKSFLRFLQSEKKDIDKFK